MEITFVTTNDEKWRMAIRSLREYPIELKRAEIDTPEIQSMEIEEIAGYSAKYAANRLQKSVMVTDVGYYISALNGFPGPFQKYANHWLRPADVINLMKPYEGRNVQIKECSAFCEPGGNAVCFTSVVNAEIARKPEGKGYAIDQVMILEGFDRPQGAIEKSKVRDYWDEKLTHYRQLGEYIRRRLDND